MDIKFIESVCESYFIDKNLYTILKEEKGLDNKQIQSTKEQMANNVIAVVRNLRETDLELYDKIYDRSKLTQTRIINHYLDLTYQNDEQNQEQLNESIIALGIGAIGLTMVALFGEPILGASMKIGMKVASKIGSFFNSLGSTVSKWGSSFRMRYAIIQENALDCYRKCGIKPEDIADTSYFGVTNKPAMITTPKGVEQGKCLRECYVDNYIDTVALLFQAYFSCLKNTGNAVDFEKANSNDVLKAITTANLSVACHTYYDVVRKSFDNFNELLDFVYTDNEKLKNDKLTAMKEKLFDSKNQIIKNPNFVKFNTQKNSPGQQNKPQFNPRQNKDRPKY